jgi:hypothetical protein
MLRIGYTQYAEREANLMPEQSVATLFRTCLVGLLFVLPPASWAADKEVVRLQRDVALLSDDVRRLMISIDKRLDDLTVVVQRTLARVDQSQGMTALTHRTLVGDREERQEKIDALVVTLGQVRADGAAMKDTALDLNARLKRVEEELSEVSDAVRIIQAPAPPPPSASEALGGPPAGMDASDWKSGTPTSRK